MKAYNKKEILKKLSKILTEMEVDNIYIESNTVIDELNLDSLKIFDLICKINKEFSIDFNVIDLLECTKVSEIINKIYYLQLNFECEENFNKLCKTKCNDNYLNPLQRAYFLSNEIDNKCPKSCRIVIDFNCNGKLDSILKKIIKVIKDEKKFHYLINDDLEFSLKEKVKIKLENIDSRYPNCHSKILNEEIDYKKPPFVKIYVDKKENNILLCFDMINFDGESITLFFQKVFGMEVTGRFFRSASLEESKKYWISKGKIDIFKLNNSSYNIFDFYNYSIVNCFYKIANEDWYKINDFLNENNVSVTVLFIYIYLKALYDLNKENNIILLPVNGRIKREEQREIGNYTKVIPFCIDLCRKKSGKEVLNEIKKQLIEDIFYKEYDANLLREYLINNKVLKRTEIISPYVLTCLNMNQILDNSIFELNKFSSVTPNVGMDIQLIYGKDQCFLNFSYANNIKEFDGECIMKAFLENLKIFSLY